MTNNKKLKKMIQDGYVKFVHIFNPKSKYALAKYRQPISEESWEEALKESYKHRKDHTHGFRTDPSVITIAKLKDGNRGYSWCSMVEDYWDRKKGNRIALIRALASRDKKSHRPM